MVPYMIRDARVVVMVHVTSWRTTYDGIIKPSRFDEMERHLDDRVAAAVNDCSARTYIRW